MAAMPMDSKALDGLRGVLALYIVVYHYLLAMYMGHHQVHSALTQPPRSPDPLRVGHASLGSGWSWRCSHGSCVWVCVCVYVSVCMCVCMCFGLEFGSRAWHPAYTSSPGC